jgi:hypothetical protein
MPMPILLLALQTAGGMVANSSPPPPVISVPSGQPMVYRIPEANEAPPDRLEIRVRSASQLLWEGVLRVGKPGASLVQYLSQTEPSGCPESHHGGSVFSSLNVSAQRDKLSTSPEGAFSYTLRINWERPNSARGCMGDGRRSVQISQSVDLRPGQQAILRGDVGLQVEIRRR